MYFNSFHAQAHTLKAMRKSNAERASDLKNIIVLLLHTFHCFWCTSISFRSVSIFDLSLWPCVLDQECFVGKWNLIYEQKRVHQLKYKLDFMTRKIVKRYLVHSSCH